MDNYLASGLESGFATGADIVKQKRAREEAERQAAIDRQLRLDLQAKQQAAEKQLQDDRLVADAQKQFSSQGFQHTENAADRNLRLTTQANDQTFTGGQNNLNRGLTQQEIDAKNRMNDAQVVLDARKLSQQADQAAAQIAEHREERADTLNRGQVITEPDPLNPGQNRTRVVQPFIGTAPVSLQPSDNLSGASSASGTGLPTFGSTYEGKRVVGPDGKSYVIKNGKPTLAQ